MEPELDERHLRWHAQLKYGDTGKALICANFAALGPSAGATCNPDFNFGVIGINTVWTPLKGLAFTADLSYSRLDQKYSGTVSGANTAAAAKPAAVYELKDQDSLQLLLRAQRNF
ncbi:MULTISPECIES: porin [Bradyrhizobium]|uniref:porin n=1 Tax=Bradyrhizobium TaxID=374 RepID=UPI002867F92C|nr:MULTISPECIES: porin [Bradyrhizobium]